MSNDKHPWLRGRHDIKPQHREAEEAAWQKYKSLLKELNPVPPVDYGEASFAFSVGFARGMQYQKHLIKETLQ